MRIVDRIMKKGCYQIVFQWNSMALHSTHSCIGLTHYPFEGKTSDRLFGHDANSVAYFVNGQCRLRDTSITGNSQWTPTTKTGDCLVGAEVAVSKKENKSKIIFIFNNTRQPVYFTGLPHPCQFGVCTFNSIISFSSSLSFSSCRSLVRFLGVPLHC